MHLVGLDARGGIVLREKVARTKIVSRLANVSSCLIGAYHQARQSLPSHALHAGCSRRSAAAKELDEGRLWTLASAAAQRLHHNVLATALANKLARIARACWHSIVYTRRV
jgi:hypothetical protein